jgi:hypothetical protein
VEFCPVQNELLGPAWQISLNHGQLLDVDNGFEITVFGMEVWRSMIIEEHLDENSIEGANRGHG